MTINSGKVGIGGLSAPASELHLYDGSSPEVQFSTPNTGTSSIDGFVVGIDSVNGDARIWNFEGSPIDFGTSNLQRMRIASSGNVGIGTTNPVAKLDVSGDIRATQICDETGSNCKDISTGWSVGNDSITSAEIADGSITNADINASAAIAYSKLSIADGDLTIAKTNNLQTTLDGKLNLSGGAMTGNLDLGANKLVGNGGTEGISIDASGNVGIGITNPTFPLHVNTSAKIGGNLTVDNIRTSGTAPDMKFTTNGLERMTIESNGNVGIGTSTPAANLDVVGDIQYTGTLTDVSDKRLKENILPLANAMKRIRKVKTYSYNMINDPLERTEFGVVAQEMRDVFPELVRGYESEEFEDMLLSVNYVGLIPWLLSGLNEIDEQVLRNQKMFKVMKEGFSNHERRIANLESKNKKLQNKVEKLERENKEIKEKLNQILILLKK